LKERRVVFPPPPFFRKKKKGGGVRKEGEEKVRKSTAVASGIISSIPLRPMPPLHFPSSLGPFKNKREKKRLVREK